jgi:hypothetical protein
VWRASRQHAARLFIQESFNQNRHRIGSYGTINRYVANHFVVKTTGAAVVPSIVAAAAAAAAGVRMTVDGSQVEEWSGVPSALWLRSDDDAESGFLVTDNTGS